MQIQSTGEYVTRNGKRVAVQQLGGRGTFSVRGYIWLMFRGKVRPRRWQLWTPTGAISAFPHPLDIVGTWED